MLEFLTIGIDFGTKPIAREKLLEWSKERKGKERQEHYRFRKQRVFYCSDALDKTRTV
jgi:hypothetical protein